MKLIYLILLIPLFLLSQTTVFDHSFDYAPNNYQSSGANDENAWPATTGSPTIELSNGSLCKYEASGGWSGGAAVFYPHDNGRCGFEQFPSGSWTRMNMRFLVYFNSGFSANRGAEEIKYTIVFQSARTWISFRETPNFGCGWEDEIGLNYNNTLFGLHGCAAGNCSSYPWNDIPTAVCDADWSTTAASPFKIGNYEGEWVCLEYEVNSSGSKTIYIWTQDSVYTDSYLTTTDGTTGNITGFDCTWINANAGNNSDLVYWKWDEFKIVVNGSSEIGPPDGFYDETPTPDDNTPPSWTQSVSANGNDSLDIDLTSISSDLDCLQVAFPDSGTVIKLLRDNSNWDTTVYRNAVDAWNYVYVRGVDDSSNVNPFVNNIDSVWFNAIITGSPSKPDTIWIIQN